MSRTLKLRVTAAAERAIRSGHPWVFSDSVKEANRPGNTGELAVIYDRSDRFLAVGLFDEDSPLRVRVLHAGKPVQISEDWWISRLDQAIARRAAVLDEATTGCRLIHGENDGWPGLVLDQYQRVLVMKLYSAAWLPRLEDIVRLIVARLAPESLVLRLSRNIQAIAETRYHHRDGEVLTGAPVTCPVVFRETGLQFEAEVLRGQKTGFFLDQRENRRLIAGLAADREVLNAFSFSGGFSLYAARGGAKSVTDIDLSEHALASARRNFALNRTGASIACCRHECVQADAFEWLPGNPGRKFDLIVLDPPSLARRESERAGAIHAYQQLASRAIGHLRNGGILLACSCSAHVTEGEFFEAVRHAAKQSHRAWSELETTGHPPDHPATYPEANYLKGIYLQF